MKAFTACTSISLVAALAIAATLTAPSHAQQVLPPPPPETLEGGIVPADPHAMLDELSGGPDGSPTALRLNPLPGTSTSIPTTNPAAVPPIGERQGETVVRQETGGIEGQCDPVVGLGNCPNPAVETDAGSEGGSGASMPEAKDAGASGASPGAPGGSASDASVPPVGGTTDGVAAGAGGATN